MTELIQENKIAKIADEMNAAGELEMYWGYRDALSEEQTIKIITEEDGLSDVEDELYGLNMDYVPNVINGWIKNKNISLTDDEEDELRLECESRFDWNIDGLIKNSQISLRVTLMSNEDMIFVKDSKQSETIKYFKKRFRNKFKIADLKTEIANCTSEYGLITFYFKVRGKDILKLREEVMKGFITLRSGLSFGLFNFYVGGGSILEMKLLHSIRLNMKDWRLKDDKEAVVQRIENKDSEYYYVSIKGDNISKYGIQETYGLCSWQEW